MKTSRLYMLSILAASAVAASAGTMSSGWDDDDDIYYNPSKAPAAAPAAKPMQTAEPVTRSTYVPNQVVAYPGSDTYSPSGAGLNVNIDDYNRRGQFLVADTATVDTTGAADTYLYTRRLERFYNSDIVNASGDTELIDSYYATPASTDINIYVVNNDPWSAWNYPSWGSYTFGWNFWNNFYYNGWSWTYYNPYHWWGPSWSWGPAFGWGPTWGWSPSWGWGDPGWCCGWAGPVAPPSHGWATTTPGASRPHNPAIGGGSSATHRPGAISAGAASATGRPGNMGHATRNPGSTGTSTRPGGQSVGSITSGAGLPQISTGTTTRGRGTTTSPSNNSTRRPNSTPSYNNYNNTSRGSSTSSYSGGGGGGSRSTHSSAGGGSHSSGGGGGSRGRR